MSSIKRDVENNSDRCQLLNVLARGTFATLGYVFFRAGEGTRPVAALASNFHIAGSRIFTRVTAVFFAIGNHTATWQMCTSVLLLVGHLSLRSF